jgi:hypothetical protein
MEEYNPVPPKRTDHWQGEDRPRKAGIWEELFFLHTFGGSLI